MEEAATWKDRKSRENKGRILISVGGAGGYFLLGGALVAAASVLGFTVRVLGKKRNVEKGEAREVEEGHDSVLQCLPSPSSSDLPPPPPSPCSPSDYSDNGSQGAEDYVEAGVGSIKQEDEELQSQKEPLQSKDMEDIGHREDKEKEEGRLSDDGSENSSSESEKNIWPAEASDSSSSSSMEDINYDRLMKLRFDAKKYVIDNNKETQQAKLIGKDTNKVLVATKNSSKVYFRLAFAFVFALALLLLLMGRHHQHISEVIYPKGTTSPEL